MQSTDATPKPTTTKVKCRFMLLTHIAWFIAML